MATEARTMEYARAHGYPVPAVEEISDDGTDLVLERVTGPSMVAAIGRRPWTIRHQATVLAELHRRLHDIPAPHWLPPAPCGEGDRLLHLDLHPLNVMLTGEGPVVIDWPNAVRGEGTVDVALTWVLMASGGIPFGRVKAAVLGRGRALLVNSFLRDFDLATVRPHLADIVEWKVKDPNMTDVERRAMWQLATSRGTA
jgi:hypothetical protein